jgi:acetyltransferase-like isoleucine patch superfamily enzyme
MTKMSSRITRYAICGLTTPLPWPLRRRILNRALGYRLHPASRIGLSFVAPRELAMGGGAHIGHLTVCRGLDRVELGRSASIGHLNWITGWSADQGVGPFSYQQDRRSELVLAECAAIASRHIIDCTNAIYIGRFTTIGGWRSQLVTHFIDTKEARQSSSTIRIGEYCYVGTGVVILGGAVLPDYCVLGAHSFLGQALEESYRLYGGTPARAIKDLDPDHRYFSRRTASV